MSVDNHAAMLYEATQAAAIPYRLTSAGTLQALLVTTSSGRWSVPKGCIDPGRSAAEAALCEALEEAGVTGVIAPRPIGVYDHVKLGARVQIVAFPLLVDRELETWAEQWRSRVWLPAAPAAARVASAGLARLILQLAAETSGNRPGRRKSA